MTKPNWINSRPVSGTAANVGSVGGVGARDPRKDVLRAKIVLAKRRLQLPKLMLLKGDGAAARKSARCPFHGDANRSFSVYQSKSGEWLFHCFAGCGHGDEIDYVMLRDGVEKGKAIALFLKLAGV
ncbi:MAG: CHC2 zinc finger domain-containing protein [Limisphaerales bacterium]